MHNQRLFLQDHLAPRPMVCRMKAHREEDETAHGKLSELERLESFESFELSS